jgi:hypothetical protein
MVKEIVISAYDKDIKWISRLGDDVKKTIYRKGDVLKSEFVEIDIENFGRCVHTFFNHIYLNYDSLSDYTFFAQDYPFDHFEDIVEVINNNSWEDRVSLKIGGYYGFHFNSIGTMWNMFVSDHFNYGYVIKCLSNGMPQDHNPNINVDSYWENIFIQKSPPIYEFIPGGHFMITREHARLRSRDFYKNIVEFFKKDANAPWCIERLEGYIFDTKYKSLI